MINLKFLIDITQSNKNNLPAIYHYLDQLLTWLETILAFRGDEKQYVAGYICGNGLCGNLKVFKEKDAFLNDFKQQKIQKGNLDGKENIIKAIEDTLNQEIGSENALFVFTDQTMEQAHDFRPLEKTYHLTAVYLFADYCTNVTVKNINRFDFEIDRDKSGTSDAPVTIQLEAIKKEDAMNGGEADIRMMVGKMFTQDSREVQGLL
ncbi:MAG: hypothetical protein IKV59_03020 [Lachnospiraceae bacterium]|nr:hypothetical protein [Lachnospiraceae bacterium]